MKETRAAFALLFFIIAAHIAYLLPQAITKEELSESYSITTCPGPVNGANGTALIPSKQIGVRELNRRNADFAKPASGNVSLSRGAIIVAGNPINSWTIQTKPGKWTSAITCASGATTSWFVGGTANVTSQGKIVLINSGLSDAVAALTTFSESGPSEALNVTVKALSAREIRIDSLQPGANRLVVKVNVLNGRLTSFMTDERVRGLNNIGGDYISPITEPKKELIIAGLPSTFGSTSKLTHTLRVMSTEKVDANLSVEVISSEGVYVPVSLGSISLNAGEVVDVPLDDLDLARGSFGLKVVANSEIVAGVFTEVTRGSTSDFMWNSATPNFESVSFNIYGLEPQISFIGEDIRLSIQWRDRTGKTKRSSLQGQEILNWRVPANARLITISSRSEVGAGMSWITNDGVAHLPIASSATLESAARPRADIGVIQPRS
jgi:hypothetical protein